MEHELQLPRQLKFIIAITMVVLLNMRGTLIHSPLRESSITGDGEIFLIIIIII
jgi:hypothetical protein